MNKLREVIYEPNNDKEFNLLVLHIAMKSMKLAAAQEEIHLISTHCRLTVFQEQTSPSPFPSQKLLNYSLHSQQFFSSPTADTHPPVPTNPTPYSGSQKDLFTDALSSAISEDCNLYLPSASLTVKMFNLSHVQCQVITYNEFQNRNIYIFFVLSVNSCNMHKLKERAITMDC
jgi:hypothetical protein